MDGISRGVSAATLPDFDDVNDRDLAPARSDALPRVVDLRLRVRDPEVIAELLRHDADDDPDAREHYALTALRLGVIALRQAAGVVDANAIQKEATRLIHEVDRLVTGNADALSSRLSESLREYFDPTTGKLPERLGRLVHRDGELSRLLSEHLDGESSRLARTLAQHVGAGSPIMQVLSPQQKDGLLSRLQGAIADALRLQAEQILKQFSLDDRQSALSRCLEQLTDCNGKLRKELAADVDAVKREFSLDNPDGALHRLVHRVEDAHRSIAQQFSLDNEQSAMNRLSGLMERTRESMQQQIAELVRSSTDFHGEVRQTLAVLAARKEEAARGTQHGVEFEKLVAGALAPLVQPAGDLIECVGGAVGRMLRCKKGDLLVTLGPECAAPGARIVVECKEDASFTESAALAELAEARPNRDAQVGIFVFSKRAAPSQQPPLRRVGNDVLCVWDKDDPHTDVILTAALSIARALVVRQKVQDEKKVHELAEIEDAVNRIETAARKLDEVERWAGTIVTNGQKIADHARSMREEIAKRVDLLRGSVAEVKTV